MMKESFDGDEKEFEENVGEIYGYVDARPYLRAFRKLGTLWIKMAEAEDDPRGFRLGKTVYADLLRFTKGDNQGIRLLLPFVLLELGEIQETVDFVKARCWQKKDDDAVGRSAAPSDDIFYDFLELEGDCWFMIPECNMDAEGLLALVIARFMVVKELNASNSESWLVKLAASKKMSLKDAAADQMKIFMKLVKQPT
jgi:hypothetical protein